MDHEKELVEALTDADWAGDKSTPASHIGGGAESLYVASWPGRKWWQESLQILQVAEPLRNGKAWAG